MVVVVSVMVVYSIAILITFSFSLQTRWTPLHRAVNYNQINVVKVMLSHDSDGVTLDTTLRDSVSIRLCVVVK